MAVAENSSNLNFCLSVEDYFNRTGIGDVTSETWIRILFIALYTAIFVLGVLGNSCVIVAVAMNKKLQTVRNLFIISLSASDMVVCCASLPYTACSILYKVWLFGEVMCYSIPLIQGMSVVISIFTLTAISVDRYILIVHPTKPSINRVAAGLMIAVIWLIAAGISVPNAVFMDYVDGKYVGGALNVEVCGHFCMENPNPVMSKAYGAACFAVQFIVPLTVIVCCYAHIVYKLNMGMSARKLRNRSSHVMSDRQMMAMKRQRRTNRMLIAMVGLFAVSGIPMVTFNILRDWDALPDFVSRNKYLASLIAHCLAMTATFWNPLLYGFMNETFRAAFMDLLPCLKLCMRSPYSHGAATDNILKLQMDDEKEIVGLNTALEMKAPQNTL